MPTQSTISIEEADLATPSVRSELIGLVEAFAVVSKVTLRPGHAEALDELLQTHPTVFVFLAREVGGRALGYAMCQKTISSFEGAPSVNLHDIYLDEAVRGRGVGREMIATLERKARSMGCRKITLEVDRENTGAQRLYKELGFADGSSDRDGDGCWFWRKMIGEG
jgi:ribosomal protein S18 acetylase RimI-like enzyme